MPNFKWKKLGEYHDYYKSIKRNFPEVDLVEDIHRQYMSGLKSLVFDMESLIEEYEEKITIALVELLANEGFVSKEEFYHAHGLEDVGGYLIDYTPSKNEYVYFIQAGEDGEIKIGKANNVQKRYKALQTSCPQDLYLLGAIETKDAYSLEKQLHERFAQYRVMHSGCTSEWFRVDAKTEILDLLNTINCGNAERNETNEMD